MVTWLIEKLVSNRETAPPTSTSALIEEVCAEVTAALVVMRDFSEQSGLPCVCYDRVTRSVVGQTDHDLLPFIPEPIAARLEHLTSVTITPVGDQMTCFVSPLPFHDRFVVAGYAFTSNDARPAALLLAAAEAEWSEAQLSRSLKLVPLCAAPLLQRLVDAAGRHLRNLVRESEVQTELNSLSAQIDYTYEEISLLHRLTHNLHLSRPSEELASMCVQGLHGLIECSGAAICLEDADAGLHFLTQGRLPFDESGLARLLVRFEQHDWNKPLIKNKLQHTLVGADFPGLKSLVVVPIGTVQHRRGWIVACNLRNGREFGSIEANLLSSVATILGTHVRNIELYDEHDDLLIGFVRSLVTTLDAKDPYTRGHSERVALIARRLGEQLGLEESDLDDIYLSALLHDIGKIGVDDRILAKPGQLTEEEFLQIQRHPMIGYQILQQLKTLKQILPGVRNHHEAYNGRGYPDQLKGDEIPLMARIIAVADSFDAMVSDRPYRQGMALERLEDIFRRGSGEQWDPRLIDAYFACRDDIQSLFKSYSPNSGNLLRHKSATRTSSLSGRNLLR